MNSEVALEHRPVVVLGDISRSMRSNTIKQTVLAGTILSTVRVAAVYIRYSTAAQGEKSETRQSGLTASYAIQLGASLYKVYVDRGRTGTTMVSRSAFSDLMIDAAAGKFNVLIVEALDRVSRAMTDLQHAYRRLIRLGVEIHEVNGTKIDPISLLFKGLQAVADRTTMLERTSGGRAVAILSGRVLSRPRYGYVIDPIRTKERLVHPERAAVVLGIYMDYDDGMDPCEIAARLDGVAATPQQCVDQDAAEAGRVQGRKKKLGPPRWTEAMVVSILRCPLYGGQVVDRTTKARKNERGDVVGLQSRPEKDHLIATAPDHLVIVDPELARRVTDRVEDRYAAGERGASSSTYLLTGRLTCGACGRKLSSYTQNGHRKYVCPGERDGSCEGVGRPKAATLEAAVIGGLVELERSPDVEARYRPAYEAAIAAQAEVVEVKRDRIKAEIDDIDTRLVAARTRGVELGFGAQTITQFCLELEGTRANAAMRLSVLRVPSCRASGSRASTPGLDDALACLKSKLPLRGKDPETRRLMSTLRDYVNQVVVEPAFGEVRRHLRVDVNMGRVLGGKVRAGVVPLNLDLPD